MTSARPATSRRSTEPWLEDLPEHWTVVPMQRVVRFGNGADYKDLEVSKGGYPVYGSGGIFSRASTYLYDGESVLFGRKGTIDRPLYVRGKFWTVDTMYFTVPSPAVFPKYLYYVATTIPFGYYTTSTALPSMTSSDLGRHRMPLPPLGEQRRIADFLDAETAQIDALIAEQGHFIALLRERRTTEIARVVQGDPTWPLLRLSWLFNRIGSGTTPPADSILPAGQGSHQWVTTSELREVGITETKQTLSEGTVRSTPALRVFPAGTLLIAMYGATIGRLGWLETAATTNQACCAFAEPRGVTTRWAYYCLLAAKPALLLLASGGGQPNINQDKLRSMRIRVPPLGEQNRLTAYLDTQGARVDALIAEAEHNIALSKERKAALITAAVTGRIDVSTRSAA
ncbi:restriction endonuclease subunit S [Actinotalea caeni]|uniref:restriction endonuclease subunit S n=1 Tax=Actinotalea caeni TaxID=1348467 RepID=UPI0013917BC6|nr:restriction endonuclease subunit S [Actinotalea caeni]